ncbi:two pore domain potassium channel family protein [Streptomyces sp. ISL-36]|uniref:potassium channel family protein n=1 Tax=Streptomyces sp. ISL-36 TaxID=2819182 RepID=UPI001BE58213|nr:potassium channel family protein [Streptomyces sp. ISL-36]MBT2442602.1 two pore domain potassium channel family protein [Streptomyces sp. ISL-36]
MAWTLSLVGGALVVFVLRDVFHTLWHPTRHGGLSRLVMTALWRLSRRLDVRRRAAGLAGPLGMVAVFSLWALGVALGWALLYWPHMPGAFSYSTGLEPSEHATPVDALYVSLVTVATLGLGDIAPEAGWLRLLAPLEALVGFALLSAIVSWILGVYPALARRRALALRLSQLRRTHATTEALDSEAGAALLDSVASDVCRVSIDFMQYPESYYFYDGEARLSLAEQIDFAAGLAGRAAKAGRREVGPAAAALDAALDDLALILDERFLHTRGSTTSVLDAYAADHGGQAS